MRAPGEDRMTVPRLVPILLIAALAALAGCTERPPLAGPTVQPSGPYRLDTGDQLRIVVYDQPSLTNIYEVDATGAVAMPLIGNVAARNATAAELAGRIEGRLSAAYLREPDVTVEVATYRPFFVLGEVASAGQYSYVPGITAETAIAVAGGFTDRANKRVVRVTRSADGRLYEAFVPVTDPIRPGDTIYVVESLF
jgi:polysaccharide export outer membrane protein